MGRNEVENYGEKVILAKQNIDIAYHENKLHKDRVKSAATTNDFTAATMESNNCNNERTQQNYGHKVSSSAE